MIQGMETAKSNGEFEIISKKLNMWNNPWDLVKLGDVVQINPSRTLRKTKEAFHLAMRDIEVHRREISSHSYKEFSGSGTRF